LQECSAKVPAEVKTLCQENFSDRYAQVSATRQAAKHRLAL
jgi:hypothetical protein